MMARRLCSVAGVAATALLTGCAGMMSGLDANSSFSCKAAPGVTCQSISGVHQNASANNLPFQKNGDPNLNASASDEDKEKDKDKKPAAYGAAREESGQKVSPRDMVAANSGMPVRQPPLVLRVWMAPYEDEGGDLHDQSYFYTMVHSGRWMIEANRSSIANQYRPIYPLNRNSAAAEKEVEKEKQPLIQKGNYDGIVQKPDLN